MNIKRDKNEMYVCVISLVLFFAVIYFVAADTFTVQIDSYVNSNIRNTATFGLDLKANIITLLGDSVTVLILSILLAIAFIFRKKTYASGFLISSVFGGMILGYLTKILVQRERPENAIIESSGFSFPSGHALNSMIFFSLLVYLFKDDIKSAVLKNLFVFSSVLLIFAIGLTRIYLRVHWVSDVIGSWFLGLFWLSLMIWTFGFKLRK